MPANELELFRQAGRAAGGIAVASASIISSVRQKNIVLASDRQRIKDELASMRRLEISNLLTAQSLRDMSNVMKLVDAAEQHEGHSMKYSQAMVIVNRASQALESNFDKLQRDFR